MVIAVQLVRASVCVCVKFDTGWCLNTFTFLGDKFCSELNSNNNITYTQMDAKNSFGLEKHSGCE